VPSTVGSLFAAASAKPQGAVRWRQGIPPPEGGPATGIYVVSLTPATDRLEATLPTCPISTAAVRELLEVRPELRLDGGRPDVTHLAERLASFWCPDEVVLYVGRAGPRKHVMVSELADRVTEYCTTPLGARSPHAGGWPLKTLANLDQVYVHFAYCANYIKAEERMLDRFAERLSNSTRESLYDSTVVMPFANLQDGHGRRKPHRITGARAPRTPPSQQPAPPMARAATHRTTSTDADAVPARATVSAPLLARRLQVNPKTLRAWLRSQARAGHALLASHEHYGRWWFTEAEARQLAREWADTQRSRVRV
jgi:hypothetical protein